MIEARLVPVDGGEPIELTRDVTLVGRRDDCDLSIDHKSISKEHCVLVRTEGVVLVRDLGSTNGTRVNGQRVRRGALVPNDEIAFAAKKYRLTIGRPLPLHNAVTQGMPAEAAGAAAPPHEMPEPETPAPGPARVEVRMQELPDVYPAEPTS